MSAAASCETKHVIVLVTCSQLSHSSSAVYSPQFLALRRYGIHRSLLTRAVRLVTDITENLRRLHFHFEPTTLLHYYNVASTNIVLYSTILLSTVRVLYLMSCELVSVSDRCQANNIIVTNR